MTGSAEYYPIFCLRHLVASTNSQVELYILLFLLFYELCLQNHHHL